MKADVTWVGKRTFIGTTESGHSIAFGAAHGEDGKKPGPSPMELLLLGTGGCSAYDVVMILTKQREPLEGLEVTCTGEQAAEAPYQFTHLHLHYKLKGSLNQQKVERAIHLSEDKYCSVLNTLKPTVEITNDFEIEA